MSDSSQHSEYEFEPFEHVFLRRREQIDNLIGLTSSALRHLNGVARLSEVLRRPAEHVELAREVEGAARSELESGMPLIHGSAAVLMWGALEASIRDFLVRWLTRYPSARQSPDLRSVKVRVVEYEGLSTEDRMRYLVGILERELGAPLKPGIARFECLLKPFDIHAGIDREDRRTLNELAAVRNVIVHRAGVADERLLELCPWLGLHVGQEVNVGRDTFVQYRRATSEFAVSVIQAARAVSARYGDRAMQSET